MDYLRQAPGKINTLKGRYSSVILDLDGTVADSAPGILGSLETAFTRVGLKVPPASELMTWIGPSMRSSLLERARLDESSARAVLAEYREYYDSVGVLNATMYSGMGEVINALSREGVTLGIATSKPETPARALVRHLGLGMQFKVVRGASEGDGPSTKREVLASTLSALAEEGQLGTNPVMIGDRHHDIDAAGHLGVASIFAQWGYGMLDEAKGATAIAATPLDLIPLLLDT